MAVPRTQLMAVVATEAQVCHQMRQHRTRWQRCSKVPGLQVYGLKGGEPQVCLLVVLWHQAANRLLQRAGARARARRPLAMNRCFASPKLCHVSNGPPYIVPSKGQGEGESRPLYLCMLLGFRAEVVLMSQYCCPNFGSECWC